MQNQSKREITLDTQLKTALVDSITAIALSNLHVKICGPLSVGVARDENHPRRPRGSQSGSRDFRAPLVPFLQ